MENTLKIGGTFYVKCFDKDGNLKWEDDAKNLITNVGLNHILDVTYHGTTQVSTWYIGLKNVGSTAAADTLSSHSGWTENSNYTGDRQEYVEAAASGQSITNSANKAAFTFTTDSNTVAGAFLASAATGTTGTLICVADFTGGNKSVDTTDQLEVTYTINAADA